VRLLPLAPLGVLLLGGAALVWSTDCATATALTVDVFSEVPCAQQATVDVVGGSALGDLEAAAPSASSTECTAAGAEANMGSVVLLPAASRNGSVAFAVMTRPDGQPPDRCLDPTEASGCIVARRELSFIPHTGLAMRIDLRLTCLGVACPGDETCVKGACVSAVVPSGACTSSCDEGALAPADGGVAVDAPVDSPGDSTVDAPAAYSSLSDPTAWQAFDLSALSPTQAGEYNGVVYDGRYVYYAPFGPEPTAWSTLARLDTQGAFTAASSWTVFDLTMISPNALAYRGAAFDGAHVYLAPAYENTTGTALRYDVDASVTEPASYQAVTTAISGPGSGGFFGAVFDGRYVYLAPDTNGPNVVRFDSTMPFTSFDSFPLTSITSQVGYHGGIFDGRYLYLVPYEAGSSFHGTVARYDTTAPFDVAASWTTFDLTQVNPDLAGFVGAGFDGRYLYFAPWVNALAVRYDTTAPFASASSWTSLDISTPFAGTKYRGVAYDGRHVYFIPNTGGSGPLDIASLDTTAGSFDMAAFDSFDLTTLPSHAYGYVGAVFDGQYLYLGPESGSVALRFTVRSTKGPLTSRGGSFL